jgi:hypothetical protein
MHQTPRPEWVEEASSAGGKHLGGFTDDRIGRALDTLFAADAPSLVLSVMTMSSGSSGCLSTSCITTRHRSPFTAMTPRLPPRSRSSAARQSRSHTATSRLIGQISSNSCSFSRSPPPAVFSSRAATGVATSSMIDLPPATAPHPERELGGGWSKPRDGNPCHAG